MAYMGRPGATAPLTTADIPDNSITGAKIVAGTIEASDVAADMATQAELDTVSTVASAALPKAGGAMTGAITTNSTFDGVDIATRDAVLTSTTTTANAALPKAGGTMTGTIADFTSTGIDDNASGATAITIDSDENVSLGTDDILTLKGTHNEGGAALRLTGTDTAAASKNLGSISFGNTSDTSLAMIRGYSTASDAADLRFYTEATGGSIENRMTIDSSGRITTTGNPRFSAYRTVNGSFTLTNPDPFPFNATRVNVGNHYDASSTNYKFVAPVTGDYYLHFQSIFQGTSVNGWIGLMFSTGTHSGYTTHFNEEFSNASAWKQVILSGIYHMTAGCEVFVKTNTITTFHGGDYSIFCGHLIG
jgi:hypothetical protein